LDESSGDGRGAEGQVARGAEPKTVGNGFWFLWHKHSIIRLDRYLHGIASLAASMALPLSTRGRFPSLRVAPIDLHNEVVSSDEILHQLEYELDIEAVGLGIGPPRVSAAGVRRL
jgi:hypothetical protein